MQRVQRGQDLEGLIRQNELLRMANKRLNYLCKSIISSCSGKISELLPQLPPFEADLADVPKLAKTFALHLQTHLAESIQSYYSVFQGRLAEERQNYLKLQTKIQQYQSTISEMSLIIQRLEMKLQERQMDIDALEHELMKERIEREKIEESELKWRGRYDYVRQRLESARDQEGEWPERPKIDIYS